MIVLIRERAKQLTASEALHSVQIVLRVKAFGAYQIPHSELVPTALLLERQTQ